MRILFVGGTGSVGQSTIPHLLTAGHDVVLAHTGAHEPRALTAVEHLHGDRADLLAPGGAADHARPDAIVDTFAGGATAAKAEELSAFALRSGVAHVVVTSSVDVYRHCTDAGVDESEPSALPNSWLPLTEDAELRTGPGTCATRRRPAAGRPWRQRARHTLGDALADRLAVGAARRARPVVRRLEGAGLVASRD